MVGLGRVVVQTVHHHEMGVCSRTVWCDRVAVARPELKWLSRTASCRARPDDVTDVSYWTAGCRFCTASTSWVPMREVRKLPLPLNLKGVVRSRKRCYAVVSRRATADASD